jgi:2,4-dienoyl-CoA reductase-like NADH-dependent reductase (Old Yellow Enzyme family)
VSSRLFAPAQLGGLLVKNRIVVSPMCQYSAVDGVPQPWHHQHIGSLALSGAGLVIVEATGVEAEGRISPQCTGIWNDAQEAAWKAILDGVRSYCSTPIGIQLAHAGRKGSSCSFVQGRSGPLTAEEGAWTTYGPSAVPFADWPAPVALDRAGLDRIRDAFAAAARRADRAGFECVDLHAGHGYLLHEFCSPLSNKREDEYGGPLDNRLRFPLEVAEAVRAAWPTGKALGARITGSDWVEGGFTPGEAAVFASRLYGLGYDFVDVTSGGVVHDAKIPGGEPGYQLAFARQVKETVPGLPVMAVGMLVTPAQAEGAVRLGDADFVMLARAMLDEPRWGWRAAEALGEPFQGPPQYARAAEGAWPGHGLAHPK